jgi:hypothetical protein
MRYVLYIYMYMHLTQIDKNIMCKIKNKIKFEKTYY